MALNPNYDQIGQAFTTQYYQLFDNPATRAQLVNLYNVSFKIIQHFWRGLHSRKTSYEINYEIKVQIPHLIYVLSRIFNIKPTLFTSL